MSKEQVKPAAARRKFLTGAAAATAGAATLGFPMIAKSQSPMVIKMQGAWSATDIFNEMAVEFVTRVNEMAGGRLKVDYLVGGAVVKAFEVTDAPTADRLCDTVHVIVHATSLGGVESTIERRSKLPGQEHVPPGLLRLSVGCEHIDDLWNDLDSALEQASRPQNPA